MSKTDQLQIRISGAQKAQLKRLARAAGLDVSAYVLLRVLPPRTLRFHQLLKGLRVPDDRRFALAELNDLLTSASALDLEETVATAELTALSPYLQNYIAAMVEQAAHRVGVPPPQWCREVEPLEEPHFATDLESLRPHLFRAAPVPFKRRNLFVDSGIGDRV